jgi:hypothetical protein
LARLTATVCLTKVELVLLTELPVTVADPYVTFPVVVTSSLVAAVLKANDIQ